MYEYISASDSVASKMFEHIAGGYQVAYADVFGAGVVKSARHSLRGNDVILQIHKIINISIWKNQLS